MIIVEGQAQLSEVVATFHPRRGFADFLDRRNQQSDQHRDDRDYHQELDEGKCWSLAHGAPFFIWRKAGQLGYSSFRPKLTAAMTAASVCNRPCIRLEGS